MGTIEDKDRTRFAQRNFLNILSQGTIQDLDAFVGALTPDEQARVDSVDLSGPPTPEESTALGPNFTSRLIHRTLKEINRRADIARGPKPIADLSTERAKRQTPPTNS